MDLGYFLTNNTQLLSLLLLPVISLLFFSILVEVILKPNETAP